MADLRPEYLIDQILPRREVHMLAGPSGAGKTTWFLQTFVEQWQERKDVLGYRSFPVPWLYVSGDRSMESCERTLRRIGIPRTKVSIFSCVDTRIFNIGTIIKKALEAPVPPQFFFFEGFISLMQAGGLKNDYKDVSWFLTGLTATCKEQDITIMGSGHSPKAKSDSFYLSPRERILGSAGWGGFLDTVFMIEPLKPGDVESIPQRRLWVLPRNSSDKYIDLQFNTSGRLVEADADINFALWTAFISNVGPGGTFKTEQLLGALTGAMSRATVMRYVEQAVSDGALTRVAQGHYRVNRVV